MTRGLEHEYDLWKCDMLTERQIYTKEGDRHGYLRN